MAMIGVDGANLSINPLSKAVGKLVPTEDTMDTAAYRPHLGKWFRPLVDTWKKSWNTKGAEKPESKPEKGGGLRFSDYNGTVDPEIAELAYRMAFDKYKDRLAITYMPEREIDRSFRKYVMHGGRDEPISAYEDGTGRVYLPLPHEVGYAAMLRALLHEAKGVELSEKTGINHSRIEDLVVAEGLMAERAYLEAAKAALRASVN